MNHTKGQEKGKDFSILTALSIKFPHALTLRALKMVCFNATRKILITSVSSASSAHLTVGVLINTKSMNTDTPHTRANARARTHTHTHTHTHTPEVSQEMHYGQDAGKHIEGRYEYHIADL
jgi:hypothetical protein